MPSSVGAFYGWAFKRFCNTTSIYFYLTYFWIVALLVQWARDGGYTILVFLGFSAGPIALAYVISLILGRQGPAPAPLLSRTERSDRGPA